MRKGLKTILALATLCAVVSAYGVTCYNRVWAYCQTPGSIVNYHTYMPAEPCYGYPPTPITINVPSSLYKCLTDVGGIKYYRQYVPNGCTATVHWYDCFGNEQGEETWYFGYYQCTTDCP